MRFLSCCLVGLLSVPSSVLAQQGTEQLEPASLTQAEIDAAAELGISEDELYQVSDPLPTEERERLKQQLAYEFERDLGLMAQRTDRALAQIVKRATWALERKGYRADAASIRAEYDQFYTNAVYYVYQGITPTDLGDHKPLSQWLADLYDKIEAKLGPELCQILHLMDIKILNFGIPVVFKPKSEEVWCQETSDKPCKDEYRIHFAGVMKSEWTWVHHGVAGVIAFWAADIACMVGTFGMGAITFICGPIATVVEIGMDKYISPKLSDKIYTKVNGGL